jgi:hypothetical protein
MSSPGSFDEALARSYFRSLLAALELCHSKVRLQELSRLLLVC